MARAIGSVPGGPIVQHATKMALKAATTNGQNGQNGSNLYVPILFYQFVVLYLFSLKYYFDKIRCI